MFHPVHTYKMKYIKHFKAVDLHHDIFKDGKRVYTLPEIKEIREFAFNNLDILWEENKVDLSKACWDNKNKKIFDVAERVAEAIKDVEES